MATYLAGGVLFVVANVTFGASVVVYNAFLPEIAPPEERDAVSSKGWGIGYLGGGLLLALNLLFYSNAKALGISEGLAVRISLCSAGVWWAAFTLIPLATLRNRPRAGGAGARRGIVISGFRQLKDTLLSLRRYPQTLLFLVAYLLYNDAIQAVIALASQFGNDELRIPIEKITGVIFMVQFVAFAGRCCSAGSPTGWEPETPSRCRWSIWTGVLLAMCGLVKGYIGFVMAAAVVAIVMGGSQAISRSLFSQMIPPGKGSGIFRNL